MNLPKDYQAHILRIWQKPAENDKSQNTLHVTIENPKTAVRVNFSDLDSLTHYLKQQVDMLSVS